MNYYEKHVERLRAADEACQSRGAYSQYSDIPPMCGWDSHRGNRGFVQSPGPKLASKLRATGRFEGNSAHNRECIAPYETRCE